MGELAAGGWRFNLRMFDNTLKAKGVRLSKTLATWAVIALWLPYAALDTIFPSRQLTYTLRLALAALGLALLRIALVCRCATVR